MNNLKWTHDEPDKPCPMCAVMLNRVFAQGTEIPLPAHPHCHCKYVPTNELPTNTPIMWADMPTAVFRQWQSLIRYYQAEKIPIPPILSPLLPTPLADVGGQEPNTPLHIGGQTPYNVGGQGEPNTAVSRTNLALNTPQKTTNNRYEIALIDEGNGNGWQFSTAVLQAYANEIPPDTIPSFIDHERNSVANDRPGRRSLRDLCATITNIKYDPALNAITGIFTPREPAGELATAVLEDALNDPTVITGFSVDVAFTHDEQNNVTRITKIYACDLVYNPARGGRVVRRLFSLSQSNPTENQTMTDPTPEPTTFAPPPPDGDTAVGNTTLAQQQPATPASHTDAAAAMLMQMSQNMLAMALRTAELPPVAAERIRSQFANKTITAEQIDAAITAEQDYLSKVNRHNTTSGFGAPNHDAAQPRQIQLGTTRLTIPPNSDPLDQIRSALASWFTGGPAGERLDIVDAYVALTGDVEGNGTFDPSRINLANITDTTIAQIVSDSMNVVIAEAWSNQENMSYHWWKRVCQTDMLDSFFDVEWTTYGGFGNLSKFTPGTAVTEISVTDLDSAEDGTWEYPAGLVGIPLHTFDKASKRGWIKNLPRKLAYAAIRTLSADVSALFTANAGLGPVLSDGDNLFDAAHNNLATTALTTTAWNTAVQDMWKQTEQESGARMGMRPHGILVPIELEGTAIQILSNAAEHGTADRNINPYQYAADRVVAVPEWTDANNWAAFALPGAIGVGFRYGEVPRVVAEPGGMNSQAMFESRTLRWKVEHFYNIGVINHRGLLKRNVA